MSKLFKILRNDRGATAIEYAAIASLISVAAITAFQGLGQRVDAKFGAVNSALSESI